ncbi:MAG: hypothetical protein QW680_14120 [Pyrobaculum sp.]
MGRLPDAAYGERTLWRVCVVDPVVINYRANRASFDGVAGFLKSCVKTCRWWRVVAYAAYVEWPLVFV